MCGKLSLTGENLGTWFATVTLCNRDTRGIFFLSCVKCQPHPSPEATLEAAEGPRSLTAPPVPPRTAAGISRQQTAPPRRRSPHLLLGKTERRGRPSRAVRPDLRPLRRGGRRSPPPPGCHPPRPPAPATASAAAPAPARRRRGAYRQHGEQRGLPRVLQPHQRELHLLLPEQRAQPLQHPRHERQHPGQRPRPAAGAQPQRHRLAAGHGGAGRGQGRRRTKRHGALGGVSRDGGAAALLPLPLAADVGGVWPGPRGSAGRRRRRRPRLGRRPGRCLRRGVTDPARGEGGAVPRDGGGAGPGRALGG